MKTRQQISCPGGTLYTIAAGDNYYKLAVRFNITVEAIVTANPGVDPEKLEIGQQICIPVPPVPGPCPGGTIYTIAAGDTLYGIARRFNTTVQEILDVNPGLNPRSLQVGRRICIPARVPSCPGGTIYTIAAGDTLNRIARRFNTTAQAILDANPGLDPQVLQIGRRICVPAPPRPSCPGGALYTIVAGDTIAALARRYNTTVQAILDANPGIDPQALRIGQRICIPAPPAPSCPGGTVYTIVSGDTIAALARRYNTTVQAILDANPGIDPEKLYIGQKICIPVTLVPGQCPGGFIYVIKSGDTLSAIAYTNGITLQALLAANPQITDPDVISVGQSICVPGNGHMAAFVRTADYQAMGPCPLMPCLMCPFARYCAIYFKP